MQSVQLQGRIAWIWVSQCFKRKHFTFSEAFSSSLSTTMTLKLILMSKFPLSIYIIICNFLFNIYAWLFYIWMIFMCLKKDNLIRLVFIWHVIPHLTAIEIAHWIYFVRWFLAKRYFLFKNKFTAYSPSKQKVLI